MFTPVRSTLLVFVVSLLATSLSLAGSLPVNIRAWTIPQDGQVPFDPPPGTFAANQTVTLTPGSPFTVADFRGLNDWITPDPISPDRATFFSRDYLFTFAVEVSTLDNSNVALLEYPGNAFANWVQDPQGGVYQPQIGVTLGDPTITGSLTFGSFVMSSTLEQYDSGEQEFNVKGKSVIGTNPENTGTVVKFGVQDVPEPGTVILAGLGLGCTWLLRRRLAKA